MAQIIRVTSEALQATIRRLLPSQQGFGEDLQASNIIQPIIDLTPSAEGSEFRQDLQTALAYGSQTVFKTAGTEDITDGTGFWRVIGTATAPVTNAARTGGAIQIDDGGNTKHVWNMSVSVASGTNVMIASFDFVVYLRAQDTLRAVVENSGTMAGSARQIANSNGDLVNPSGFNPQ